MSGHRSLEMLENGPNAEAQPMVQLEISVQNQDVSRARRFSADPMMDWTDEKIAVDYQRTGSR